MYIYIFGSGLVYAPHTTYIYICRLCSKNRALLFGRLILSHEVRPLHISVRQHTPAYSSIRQHTSAYVSIRQHTSAIIELCFSGVLS